MNVLSPGSPEAYLREYQSLRSEIDSRTAVLPTLLTIELAALGAGLSVFDKFPDVTLALAVVSTFLWLVWLDQANQVRKIAAYIGVELAPKIRELAPGALRWEAFLRELEKGGKSATDLLGLPSAGDRAESWSPGDVAAVTTALFGWTTPTLVIAFGVSVFRTWEASDGFRVGFAVIVVALWLVAVAFHYRVRRSAALITNAILVADRRSAEKDRR